MSQLQPNFKTTIITLLEAGISASAIARQINKPLRTVQFWIKRYREEKHMNRKAKENAPRSTTEEQDQAIADCAKANPSYKANQIVKATNLKVSTTTIYRRLNDAGIRTPQPKNANSHKKNTDKSVFQNPLKNKAHTKELQENCTPTVTVVDYNDLRNQLECEEQSSRLANSALKSLSLGNRKQSPQRPSKRKANDDSVVTLCGQQQQKHTPNDKHDSEHPHLRKQMKLELGHTDTSRFISGGFAASTDVFTVKMDIKDFKQEEIVVQLFEKNVLSIEAKHEEREEGNCFVFRHIRKKYIIPEGFAANNINASISSEGCLTIIAPKYCDKQQPLTHCKK